MLHKMTVNWVATGVVDDVDKMKNGCHGGDKIV